MVQVPLLLTNAATSHFNNMLLETLEAPPAKVWYVIYRAVFVDRITKYGDTIIQQRRLAPLASFGDGSNNRDLKLWGT